MPTRVKKRPRPYIVPEEKRKLTRRSIVDGGGFVGNCPKCDEPVIDVFCDGVHSRLSRFSVPLCDAMVLGKYGRLIWNVWKGSRLYCCQWFPDEGRPDRGRLYTQHFCTCRR